RDRIRAEYRRRDTDERLRSRYDPNDPAVRYARDRLRAEMRSLLADRALLPLGERRILEVGCGSGAALEDLVAIGAIPSRLRGVDLSHERLSLVPAALRAAVVQADAAALPFADDSFDIVAQFTTLSSILDPALRRSVADEMRRVLRSGWLTTGPEAKAFERELAAYVGVARAVAVNSGTAALHLALEAIGVTTDDEVIVPTWTFTASAEVARYLGARPVFVDVHRGDLNIEAAAVERAITKRTKAIVGVDIGGEPRDWPRLREP